MSLSSGFYQQPNVTRLMHTNIVADAAGAADPYEQFIERLRKIEPTIGVDEYTEVHHITPRHAGGGNEAENLVRCRYADHIEAHRLRWEVYGENGDERAYLLMTKQTEMAKLAFLRTHNHNPEWQAKVQAINKARGNTVYNPEWQAALYRQQVEDGHPFTTKEGQAAIYAKLKARKCGIHGSRHHVHDPKYQRRLQKIGTKAAAKANTLDETTRLLKSAVVFSFYESSKIKKDGRRAKRSEGRLIKRFTVKGGATIAQINKKVFKEFGVELGQGVAGKLIRGERRQYKGVFCNAVRQLEFVFA